jgi:hypothetical protein
MRRRRQIEVFSISFLDLLSGALGAVIILYVALPKNKPIETEPRNDTINEILTHNIKKSEEELLRVKKELAEAHVKLSQVSSRTGPNDSQSGQDVDVGFKFKGKEILFIIDTSYSMIEEDRMGQVKAGIKMLITSLSKEFKIEVIQYPFSERAPFKTLWGVPKDNNKINQMDVFDFIYSLRPDGGTPTREVLLFALQNYESISDIVLLSDGAPTFHNSNKKDDIFDILRVVRQENSRKVQINCIGVGSEFTKDKNSDRYKFLSLLASEGDGFFVGF